MTTALTEPTAVLPTIEGEEPLFTEPAPPGTKTDHPHAPYGFTGDGKPRGKPGRKPGAASSPRPATTPKKATTPPAPAKKAAPRTPPKQPTRTDYRPGITAMLNEITGTVAIAGLMRNNPAVIADAAVISNSTPVIADMANQAADQFPVVAAILDKVLTVGPYASGVGALVLMAGQIAVNHGLIPAGLVPGTLAPHVLTEQYIQRRAAEDESFMAMLQMVASRAAAPQNEQAEPATA